MRARILLSTFSSEFAGDSKADASKVEASLVQGLTIARDCGYGLYHIDLLLERARMHLLQGSADAALDDIEVALDTGIAADDETGQVDLLAANHEECGYAWAIPYGLQLRAEALLLQAAQKLDSSTFIPAHRSALPPAVEDLLINAESCLTQALSRWHGLRDPEPERPDQNFQLGGKEYNHLSAATHRVVTDLACGLLTRYQLVRTNVTQIERKNVETVDDPKLRDDTLWLALEHAIRNVREEKQILWERKPEWEKGLNSEKINQLAQKARISERPVFEILTPIVQGGIETDRFLRVHHPDYVDPLDLCVWMKFGSPNIADKKIERLIAYLQSWQSKRSQQLRAAEAVSGPSIDPTSVSIGILTALPKEYAAVKVLLTNSQLFHQPGQGAGRTYVIGTIASDFGGLHRVALAMADMGNNIAAARATLLLEHFPSLESILMVGIAGGVPSPTKLDDHVRLGDIVVSCKKGVVQYDMVKLEEIRCCPIAPSARLVEGVRHLEAGELESKRPWDALIEFVLKQLKNERPEPATDQLFDSHDPQKSVTHPIDRKRYPDRPRVFLGPIASANELLKDPIKRDSLRDVFGVKAVEMEGSGIADASWMFEKGYLVVRGICDYCDTHKNNIWQEYAAASAGAYAAALVASLPVQNPRKHP